MVVHLTRRFSLARLISPRIICATRTQPPVGAILRNLRAISWSRSCQGNEVKYKSCTLLIVYITQVSVSVVSNLLETSGCFWGVELAYQRVPGVLETEVGYTDGHKENPSYQEVCRGTTGHTEALRVKFDPRIGEIYRTVSSIGSLKNVGLRRPPETFDTWRNTASYIYTCNVFPRIHVGAGVPPTGMCTWLL